jgi:arsenite methyltransferase
MHFSDVYANRRVPEALRNHKIMWNECLSGGEKGNIHLNVVGHFNLLIELITFKIKIYVPSALYTNDFIDIAMLAGFTQPKVVKSSKITIQNKEMEELAGHIQFTSITYRLFKIGGMETQCEDYGQAVVYRGTIMEAPHSFTLDNAHVFEKGKVSVLCDSKLLSCRKSHLSNRYWLHTGCACVWKHLESS